MERTIINQNPASFEQAVGIPVLSTSSNFIEANTVPASLKELTYEHIIPVFAKDNSLTISHADFIQSLRDVGNHCFNVNQDSLRIRVSHPVKGRIPEARNKHANDLEDWEKTLYYERAAFMMDIPSISDNVNGNQLTLSIGGVKAYNLDNLNSRKGEEHFKIFIGFKNSVCLNLCISTDGLAETIKVKSVNELTEEIYKHFSSFNAMKVIQELRALLAYNLSEQEFINLIGRARLYQYLLPAERKNLPLLRMSDTQMSSIASTYVRDENFCRNDDGSISLWNLYNLFTGANKASYIDSFLSRGANATTFLLSLLKAKERSNSHWFLN